MDASLKALLMRLGAAIGLSIIEEYFDDEVGWLVIENLLQALEAGQRLNATALLAFEALQLELRGDEEQLAVALEHALGTPPFSRERLVAGLRIVSAQLHFTPSNPEKVSLSPATFVPLKNYDFS